MSMDLANCGACGNACVFNNGFGKCIGGVCKLVACLPGFADCDNFPFNGCETKILFDPRNCGACGFQCPSFAPNCVNGTCV